MKKKKDPYIHTLTIARLCSSSLIFPSRLSNCHVPRYAAIAGGRSSNDLYIQLFVLFSVPCLPVSCTTSVDSHLGTSWLEHLFPLTNLLIEVPFWDTKRDSTGQVARISP